MLVAYNSNRRARHAVAIRVLAAAAATYGSHTFVVVLLATTAFGSALALFRLQSLLAGGPGWPCRRALLLRSGGAFQEECALACVLCEGGCPLEFGAGLGMAAQPGKKDARLLG